MNLNVVLENRSNEKGTGDVGKLIRGTTVYGMLLDLV